MARLDDRYPDNTAGEFFVDRSCINCDTCRQLAPAVFADAGGHSHVRAQPGTEADRQAASRALISCPTASIGTVSRAHQGQAIADFPWPLEDGLYYLGFNSVKTRGANSYLVVRADGNWMIDAPRFSSRLASRLEALGGVRALFHTGRANLGDGAAYADHFGALRDPQEDDMHALPLPRGQTALLMEQRYLFSGDVLAWDRSRLALSPSHENRVPRDTLVAALAPLRELSFEWLLPAHGQRIHLPPDAMRQAVQRFLEEPARDR